MPETKTSFGSVMFAEAGAIKGPTRDPKKTDESSTSSRLLHFAKWYVASRGYEFEAKVAQEIVTMTQSAASEIHTGSSTPSGLELSDSDLAIDFKTRLAEAEFGMFIDLMISRSPRTTAGHLTTIEDSALSLARSIFCPIWLIC